MSLITCSITPINHHGIFSNVKHFSRSHIKYASCITTISPWSLFHGNIFLTLCFFNIQETRTIYMDKFFHVFTLHSCSLLCSGNMLPPELSPVCKKNRPNLYDFEGIPASIHYLCDKHLR